LRLEARPLAFAILETVDLLGQMLLAVLFAALGGGATGMTAGLVLGSLIGLAAAAYQTRGLILTRPNADRGKAMFGEGIAFLPAAIAFVIANYASRTLLVAQLGADSVGLFAVGIRLAGGLALITGAFSMAWGPYGLALPNSAETGRLFGRVIRSYALLAVLLALAIGAIAPELVAVVAGDPYVNGAQMLPGLLISAAMAGGFYVLLVAAGVSGRGPSVAYAALAGSVLQVAATASLLPLLGLQAVGVAAVLGQGVALVMLAQSVGASVHRGRGAAFVMCAGGAASVLLQKLNAAPSASLIPRLIIAVLCTIVGGAIALQILRQLTAARA
jgi:O-antigen/teichoic acid export membrane protein